MFDFDQISKGLWKLLQPGGFSHQGEAKSTEEVLFNIYKDDIHIALAHVFAGPKDFITAQVKLWDDNGLVTHVTIKNNFAEKELLYKQMLAALGALLYE